MERQYRPPQLHRLVDRYRINAVDIARQTIGHEPAPAAHRVGPHIGFAERREPTRARGSTAIIGIAAAYLDQSQPDRAPQRDLAILTAAILDQQAVKLDGCGGARIDAEHNTRRPPPP